MSRHQANIRLPPEVNRIIYVRNLPYKITAEQLYDIFGKYGSIRQIRKGCKGANKGTAFVVYDDIFDAKNAVDHLLGFNVCNRFLTCLYFQPKKQLMKANLDAQQKDLDMMKQKFAAIRKTHI